MHSLKVFEQVSFTKRLNLNFRNTKVSFSTVHWAVFLPSKQAVFSFIQLYFDFFVQTLFAWLHSFDKDCTFWVELLMWWNHREIKRLWKEEDDQFQLAQHSVDFRLARQTGKVGSIAFYIRAKLAVNWAHCAQKAQWLDVCVTCTLLWVRTRYLYFTFIGIPRKIERNIEKFLKHILGKCLTFEE